MSRHGVLLDVSEFNKAMGHPVRIDPQVPSSEELRLCMNLMDEELEEIHEEIEFMRRRLPRGGEWHQRGSLARLAKELADLQYVINMTALFAGIDLPAVHDAVHESNMSKLDDDGNPVIDPDSGKVLKGPNYQPPDIERVLFPSA